MRNINKSNGFIPIYRSLFEEPIWLTFTPEQKIIYLTLVAKANHASNEWSFKGRVHKLNPGSMITSIQSLTRECGKGITTQTIRTALNKFKNHELINIVSSTESTLITLINYDENFTVKSPATKINQQANNTHLTKEYQIKDKPLANEQQANNKPLTTNNNVNNINTENNLKIIKKKYNSDDLFFCLDKYFLPRVRGSRPVQLDKIPEPKKNDLLSFINDTSKFDLNEKFEKLFYFMELRKHDHNLSPNFYDFIKDTNYKEIFNERYPNIKPELIHEIQKEIHNGKYPNVSKIEDQLDYFECFYLKSHYSFMLIKEKIEAMESFRGVANYKSLFNSLKQWCGSTIK